MRTARIRELREAKKLQAQHTATLGKLVKAGATESMLEVAAHVMAGSAEIVLNDRQFRAYIDFNAREADAINRKADAIEREIVRRMRDAQ